MNRRSLLAGLLGFIGLVPKLPKLPKLKTRTCADVARETGNRHLQRMLEDRDYVISLRKQEYLYCCADAAIYNGQTKPDPNMYQAMKEDLDAIGRGEIDTFEAIGRIVRRYPGYPDPATWGHLMRNTLRRVPGS